MDDRRERAALLYQRHGAAVYRRCLRLLGDKEAARDATQEVFGKLVKDLDRLEDRETVLPWIYRVATNHCLNQRRTQRRSGGEHEELDDALELSPNTPGDALPDRQLAQKVLERFDGQTQAVAVAVLVDGMEHEEVARALGVSSKTVSRKLQKFLLNARKFLTRSES